MPSKGMLQKINHESHDKYPYVHVGTLVSMCNTEYWGEAVVEYGKYIKLRKEAKMIIVVDKWLHSTEVHIHCRHTILAQLFSGTFSFLP